MKKIGRKKKQTQIEKIATFVLLKQNEEDEVKNRY